MTKTLKIIKTLQTELIYVNRARYGKEVLTEKQVAFKPQTSNASGINLSNGLIG